MSNCPCTADLTEFPSTVVQGDTARWCMTFAQNDGTAIDTAGWEIWLVLRESLDDTFEEAPYKAKLVVPDDDNAAAGAVVFTMHSVDSAGLEPGRYYFEFKRVLRSVTPTDVWTFKYSERPEFTIVDGTVLDL